MTQDAALDILKTGSNVYLTGCAGSGKTYVLTRYLHYLNTHNTYVGVTASTGIASTQLSGMTINAWAGIGTKSDLTNADINELLKRKYLVKRFEHTQVLIIDEISMLSNKTLEAVNKVCQAFKSSSRPFGGMQIVLCGDFFQLPPVTKFEARNTKYETNSKHFENSNLGIVPDFDIRNSDLHYDFVYKSELWEELDLKVCYLDKPYRQNDERFVKLLTEIRENNVTSYTWNTLRERFINPMTPGMTPTRLFTHNSQADLVNTQELGKLSGEEHVYDLEFRGNEFLAEVMRKSSLIPEHLVLKERALVMFIKNSPDNGYVNGTMGRVVDFSMEGYPIVQTFDEREIKVRPAEWVIEDPSAGSGQVSDSDSAKVIQLPLRLAWAITIHKSQGMTLDAAEIDLGKSFVTGMGYVALSRVRSLEGLRLRSINPTADRKSVV